MDTRLWLSVVHPTIQLSSTAGSMVKGPSILRQAVEITMPQLFSWKIPWAISLIQKDLLASRKILRKTPVYNMSMGIAALVPKEVRGSSGLVLNERIRLGQAYTVLKLLKSDQFLDDVGIPHDGLIYSNTTHDNSLIETTRIGVWIFFN
ncbi:hypothetical protein Pint_16692 [Pistacia integerrima]|uniref:Uncharacterized protein n=1 Tax=Pistacia integerrima TaxID=434235 RepID=A0ACC0ZG63_9ROSI|nr:hypothetical protein Pint_16692 [Pistacia integerrima]